MQGMESCVKLVSSTTVLITGTEPVWNCKFGVKHANETNFKRSNAGAHMPIYFNTCPDRDCRVVEKTEYDERRVSD